MSNMVLGISAFGHDASAALVDLSSGEVKIAIAEERLSNCKHDSNFPIGAIKKCQAYAKHNRLSVSHVAINYDEKKFISGIIFKEALLILQDSEAAHKFSSRLLSLHKLGFVYSEGAAGHEILIREVLNVTTDKHKTAKLRALLPWYFNWAHKFRNTRMLVAELFPQAEVESVPHHLCHAASAFFSSGFDEATVVTFDGQGEFETAGIFSAGPTGIEPVSVSEWPNSLGIFYLMATIHLGFGAGDEYKVMGMSAYGSPKYAHLFDDCIQVDSDGGLRFVENAFFKRKNTSYGHFYFDFTPELSRIIKPRKTDQPITQQHFDFAASVQNVLERCAVQMVKCGLSKTGKMSVALAGGVSLNGLMNERIRQESGCERVFVFPAAGDDGGSVGAAQYLAMKNQSRLPSKKINSVYWGEDFDDAQIKFELDRLGVIYKIPDSINVQIAKALASGEIVARFIGRSEFGPRALGHRSILADPRCSDMKEVLNIRIKHREPFRPFAPACLYENISEYFDLNVESPFMLLIVQSKEKAKNEIPAVVHADGTARVQTVIEHASPDFFQTISEFKKITGVPVVINTSFNVNGETIVETPLDAIESFGHMDIDHLAIGKYWVSKSENKHLFPIESDKEYLERRKKRYADSDVWPYDQYNLDGILAPIYRDANVVRKVIGHISKSVFNRLLGLK